MPARHLVSWLSTVVSLSRCGHSAGPTRAVATANDVTVTSVAAGIYQLQHHVIVFFRSFSNCQSHVAPVSTDCTSLHATCLQQEAQLPQKNRETRYVSKFVSCFTKP